MSGSAWLRAAVGVVALVTATALMLGVAPLRSGTPLDPRHMQAERGKAFVYRGGPAESDEGRHRSSLELFEDGRRLGPAHSMHDDVRHSGSGRYSHWKKTLVFSSSDGSDPRRNGRLYLAVHSAPAPAWLVGGLLGGALTLLAWRRGGQFGRTRASVLGVTFLCLTLWKAEQLRAALASRGAPSEGVLALLTFLLVGAALSHAIALLVLRLRRAPRWDERPGIAAMSGWLVLAGYSAAAWPDSLSATSAPAGSWLLIATAAVLPVAVAETVVVVCPTLRRALSVYVAVALAAFLAIGLAWVGRYAVLVRPSTEGVDFYYYVSFARDLAAGHDNVQDARFSYFPGVFAFWKWALRISGGSLAGLQWIYVVIVALNAALVGVLVKRHAQSVAIAVFAGIWTWMLCSRSEGFIGATEPLVTLPVLAALVAWRGEGLAGRRGVARSVVLGAGLGAGVFMKQQGALLAAGGAALVVANLVRPVAPHPWRRLLVIPGTAFGLVVVGIAAQGSGLEPLRRGLRAVLEYDGIGPASANLRAGISHIEPVGLGAGAVALGLMFLSALRKHRQVLADPRWQTSVFCILSGAAALIQFGKRPYQHYALLTIPFFVVATCIAGSEAIRRASRASPTTLMPLLATSFAMVLLTKGPRSDDSLHGYVWPITWPGNLEDRRKPWRAVPDVDSDLNALKSLVRPGEDVLVLPPRHNDIHFLLGTRSVSFEQGYGWAPGPEMTRQAVQSPSLDAVVVIENHATYGDSPVWQWLGCSKALAEMPRAGFHKVGTLKTMSVWRRKAPVPRFQ